MFWFKYQVHVRKYHYDHHIVVNFGHLDFKIRLQVLAFLRYTFIKFTITSRLKIIDGLQDLISVVACIAKTLVVVDFSSITQSFVRTISKGAVTWVSTFDF